MCFARSVKVTQGVSDCLYSHVSPSDVSECWYLNVSGVRMGAGVDSRVLQLGVRYKLRNAVFPLVLINAYSVVCLIVVKQYY